jgi:hypothetical protein
VREEENNRHDAVNVNVQWREDKEGLDRGVIEERFLKLGIAVGVSVESMMIVMVGVVLVY